MKKRVALFGASGSIGRNTLSVLDMHRDKFELYAVSVHSNIDFLDEIISSFNPKAVVFTGEKKKKLPSDIKVYEGIDGLAHIAKDPNVDIVVVATAGNVGVFPTIEGLKAGKRVALANKETLVSFGNIVMRTKRESEGELVPIDSEHSSLFQLIEKRREEIVKVILTASGGPFRSLPKERLKSVTVEDALKHPTWRMGAKITVDSATLMNKSLEIIEAHHLFGLKKEEIDVVIHPQSIVHGMIVLKDGAILAHLSKPDMRVPIQYALTYPERLESPVETVPITEVRDLYFEEPDTEKFPALLLGYKALEVGGTMPAVMNAANEVAVHAFLEGRIPFTAITEIVKRVMDAHIPESPFPLKKVLEIDYWAREMARSLVVHYGGSQF
jgi:1-deoxy-D-xylulose-5-phosphate reductoisomerase